MKKCTDCGKEKNIFDFPYLWKKKNLYRSYCKACNVLRATKWAKENRLQANENSKRSYYKNYFKDKYKRI